MLNITSGDSGFHSDNKFVQKFHHRFILTFFNIIENKRHR